GKRGYPDANDVWDAWLARRLGRDAPRHVAERSGVDCLARLAHLGLGREPSFRRSGVVHRAARYRTRGDGDPAPALARGEIDAATFNEMRRRLEATTTPAGARC